MENVQFNPENLHGTHYTLEQFNQEVEERLQEATKGEDLSESELNNYRYNIRRDVYQEWTGADTDQVVQWQMANSMEHMGIATSGYVKDSSDNPLLAPIHGISLRDYAAITMKLSSGIEPNAILNALGIDEVIWSEINTLWPKRMQEDESFTVSTLFGQYFMEGATHPKLENLVAEVSEDGKANLEKLKTDRYFYEELCGARQAAYEYGIDGAQWIQDNYGVSLGDFQAVAMEWMTGQNLNWNSDDINHYLNYQQEKQKEYAAKFAAEQGGNVADDVEF